MNIESSSCGGIFDGFNNCMILWFQPNFNVHTLGDHIRTSCSHFLRFRAQPYFTKRPDFFFFNFFGLNILCDASTAAAAASVSSHNRECQLVSRQFLEVASDIVPESSEFTPLHSTAALLPDEIPVRSRTLDALFSPRNLAISGRCRPISQDLLGKGT